MMNYNDNDELYRLTDSELDDLLYQIIRTFLIEYRTNLDIDNNYTFGLEIEYDDAALEVIDEQINEYNSNNNCNWLSKKEKSITSIIGGSLIGGEINSPILRDDSSSWKQLKEICLLLKNNYAKATDSCGGHIHIGSQILKSNDKLYNLLLVWYLYENIIFRFGYGECTSNRDNIILFSCPFQKSNPKKDFLNKRKMLIRSSLFSKKAALATYRFIGANYQENNTIEVRCPNGSINPIIIQNSVNFFCKLFLAIANDKFDMDKIKYRISELKIYGNNILKHFNIIDLNSALELCDIIFDNNLDKMCFLKQYLKNFKVDTVNKKMTLSLTR